MKRFLITAAAGLAVVAAGTLTAQRADAMPLGLPAGTSSQLSMVDQVKLCFYFDGWNGPGMYECGFRMKRGHGWHGARSGGREMHRSNGPKMGGKKGKRH